VLAVGYNNKDVEREGADHTYTTLPPGQLALTNSVIAEAKITKVPVIMMLINAGQIATDDLDAQPEVMIEAFYPSFGAPALARQLFGLDNRWGRLPYTIYEAAFATAIPLDDMTVSGTVGRTWRCSARFGMPPTMDSATNHGFCHQPWILPPTMDSATNHGFCHQP
jgi:hypothetical protein